MEMARLSELVAAMARVLKVEERSVGVCARHLREAGLIQQKGRGKSAAYMGPSDAANLFLGMMTSETLQEAPTNVRLAREATIRGPYAMPFPFINDATGAALPLGDVIDQLIDEAANYGDPLSDQGLPITHLKFGVVRPGLNSWFNLSTGGVKYIVRFTREDPRLDGLEGDDRINAATQMFSTETVGMQISARIQLEHIHAIADVLGEGR